MLMTAGISGVGGGFVGGGVSWFGGNFEASPAGGTPLEGRAPSGGADVAPPTPGGFGVAVAPALGEAVAASGPEVTRLFPPDGTIVVGCEFEATAPPWDDEPTATPAGSEVTWLLPLDGCTVPGCGLIAAAPLGGRVSFAPPETTGCFVETSSPYPPLGGGALPDSLLLGLGPAAVTGPYAGGTDPFIAPPGPEGAPCDPPGRAVPVIGTNVPVAPFFGGTPVPGAPVAGAVPFRIGRAVPFHTGGAVPFRIGGAVEGPTVDMELLVIIRFCMIMSY